MNEHDEIKLHVNGRILKNYTQYNVSQNIYDAESPFSFTSHFTTEINDTVKSGDECHISVNGVVIFKGIIDSAPVSYGKDGIIQNIQGRDLMGLVCDQYVQTWKTFRNKKLSEIAQELLREVPIVSKQDIAFENGVESLNIKGDDVQPEPGQTVFEVLRNIASSRGVLFYIRNDGMFVFSKPLKIKKQSYSFIVEKTAKGFHNKSNILTGSFVKDSKFYYKNIVVVDNTTSSKKIKSFIDNTAPVDKTFVTLKNEGTSMEQIGQNIINQQRFSASGVAYTVSGHSQNNEVFIPGKTASIKDDILGVNDNYVLYGATYKLSGNEITTDLLFSVPAS